MEILKVAHKVQNTVKIKEEQGNTRQRNKQGMMDGDEHDEWHWQWADHRPCFSSFAVNLARL